MRLDAPSVQGRQPRRCACVSRNHRDGEAGPKSSNQRMDTLRQPQKPGETSVQRTERLFFFFQAEDGIRDLTVTGVQTCALPISNVGERLETTGTGRRVTVFPVSHSAGSVALGIKQQSILRADDVRPACAKTVGRVDRKSTRLNSSHSQISYAVFCLKKKRMTNDLWSMGITQLSIPMTMLGKSVFWKTSTGMINTRSPPSSIRLTSRRSMGSWTRRPR